MNQSTLVRWMSEPSSRQTAEARAHLPGLAAPLRRDMERLLDGESLSLTHEVSIRLTSWAAALPGFMSTGPFLAAVTFPGSPLCVFCGRLSMPLLKESWVRRGDRRVPYVGLLWRCVSKKGCPNFENSEAARWNEYAQALAWADAYGEPFPDLMA